MAIANIKSTPTDYEDLLCLWTFRHKNYLLNQIYFNDYILLQGEKLERKIMISIFRDTI